MKSRISEIQAQVQSRALMAIDEKRDLLRQMIEGTVPTKVSRRKDGSVEAVYDRLGALTADAKMAGEFDGTGERDGAPELSMTFTMYHRNHPNPPRERLERELPKVSEEDGDCGGVLKDESRIFGQ